MNSFQMLAIEKTFPLASYSFKERAKKLWISFLKVLMHNHHPLVSVTLKGIFLFEREWVKTEGVEIYAFSARLRQQRLIVGTRYF